MSAMLGAFFLEQFIDLYSLVQVVNYNRIAFEQMHKLRIGISPLVKERKRKYLSSNSRRTPRTWKGMKRFAKIRPHILQGVNFLLSFTNITEVCREFKLIFPRMGSNI